MRNRYFFGCCFRIATLRCRSFERALRCLFARYSCLLFFVVIVIVIVFFLVFFAVTFSLVFYLPFPRSISRLFRTYLRRRVFASLFDTPSFGFLFGLTTVIRIFLS